MFNILIPVLNAILFIVGFLFYGYCFEDLLAVFIVLLTLANDSMNKIILQGPCIFSYQYTHTHIYMCVCVCLCMYICVCMCVLCVCVKSLK